VRCQSNDEHTSASSLRVVEQHAYQMAWSESTKVID